MTLSTPTSTFASTLVDAVVSLARAVAAKVIKREPTYYDVNDLVWVNYPVRLLLDSGKEIIAYRKLVTRTSGEGAMQSMELRRNAVCRKEAPRPC